MSNFDIGKYTQAFAADAKGSGATRARAANTFEQLRNFCTSGNRGKWDSSPEKITSKQIRQFLEHRKETLDPRTLQNEASHIRRALEGAGRTLGNINNPKCDWSNSRLGVPSATRISHKSPMDMAIFEAARAAIKQEFGLVLDLQKDLGLRMQEAIKATNAEEWLKQIDSAAGKGRAVYLDLSANAGSKGGRARQIYVPESRLATVRATVQAAVDAKASNKNGHIISRYQDKKIEYIDKNGVTKTKISIHAYTQAQKGYRNACAYLGLVGDNSNHGLRRHYAHEQYAYYRGTGLDEKEALARLSNDLGHGDGRGRWVANNYLCGGGLGGGDE
jgi:hypothetical protein